MIELTDSPSNDLKLTIQTLAFRDTIIFDPLPDDDRNLQTCGKCQCAMCGQCGQCGKCGMVAEEPLDHPDYYTIAALRQRIEANPEILADIRNRWNID